MNSTVLSPEAALEDKKLIELFSAFPEISFQPGSTIIRAGQKPSFLYYLLEGCVRMTSTSVAGKTVTLHLFQPSACFSLLQLMDPEHSNSYEYQALTPIRAKQIPASFFKNILSTQPDISSIFTKRMTKAVSGLLFRIEQSAFVPANQQLASLLLYFVKHYGEATPTGTLINFRLKHHALAEWLGLTRENVSLQLKLLEKKDFLQKQNSLIFIPDLSRLEKLANGTLSA